MSRAVTRVVPWIAVVVSAGLLVGGCENNSDVEEAPDTGTVLSISPASATLSASNHESVAFTASGGSGLVEWSMVDTNMGRLASSGASAVYTAWTNIGQNVVIVEDDEGSRASAIVNQL